jgi:hypothetical protein
MAANILLTMQKQQENILAIEDIISQVQKDDTIRQTFQSFTKKNFEISTGQLDISFLHEETGQYLILVPFESNLGQLPFPMAMLRS